MGIVSCHLMEVWKQEGVRTILEKYVVDRWKQACKRTNLVLPDLAYLNSPDNSRYSSLYRVANPVIEDILEIGSLDEKIGKEVMNALVGLRSQMTGSFVPDSGENGDTVRGRGRGRVGRGRGRESESGTVPSPIIIHDEDIGVDLVSREAFRGRGKRPDESFADSVGTSRERKIRGSGVPNPILISEDDIQIEKPLPDTNGRKVFTGKGKEAVSIEDDDGLVDVIGQTSAGNVPGGRGTVELPLNNRVSASPAVIRQGLKERFVAKFHALLSADARKMGIEQPHCEDATGRNEISSSSDGEESSDGDERNLTKQSTPSFVRQFLKSPNPALELRDISNVMSPGVDGRRANLQEYVNSPPPMKVLAPMKVRRRGRPRNRRFSGSYDFYMDKLNNLD